MGIYSSIVWFLLATAPLAGAQSGSKGDSAHPQTPPAASASAPQSDIDPAKKADIMRLLELTGAKALVEQMMTTMLKDIRPLMANSLPPGAYRETLVDLFFTKFQSKVDPQALLDLSAPVYDKYFSHAEIKQLIAFYETPLGQKAASTLPKLTAEVGALGRQWGEKIGRDSMEEVLAEHPDLAKALEAASQGGKR
jgi:uncharacterized protein